MPYTKKIHTQQHVKKTCCLRCVCRAIFALFGYDIWKIWTMNADSASEKLYEKYAPVSEYKSCRSVIRECNIFRIVEMWVSLCYTNQGSCNDKFDSEHLLQMLTLTFSYWSCQQLTWMYQCLWEWYNGMDMVVNNVGLIWLMNYVG